MRATLVLGGVGGQVLRTTDLARCSAELGRARERPAIGRVAHEVAERTNGELVAADGRVGPVFVDTQLTDPGLQVPGQPLPGPHPGVGPRSRRTTRSRATMVISFRRRASCWSRQPYSIASNTLPAARDSGDAVGASHDPLDLLMDIPSCLVLDSVIRSSAAIEPRDAHVRA